MSLDQAPHDMVIRGGTVVLEEGMMAADLFNRLFGRRR